MSLARVHNFAISLDGFGTGEGQSADAHFGHAGERLHEWMFVTRWWHEMVGQPGGTGGIDDAFARQHGPGIGAEVMGANKFGPPGWHQDPEWKGWWGPNPPFHTPTFGPTPPHPPPAFRAPPPPPPADRDGRRHDLPLHRRRTGRRARGRPGSRGRPGRP